MWCISYHPPKPTSGCLVIKSKLCPAVYNLYMLQLLPSHKEPESNPIMYTEGSNSHSFHTSHHIICLHDTCLLMKCKEWTLLHKTDIHPQTKAPLWELQDLGGPPTCIPSNRQTDFSIGGKTRGASEPAQIPLLLWLGKKKKQKHLESADLGRYSCMRENLQKSSRPEGRFQHAILDTTKTKHSRPNTVWSQQRGWYEKLS